MRRRRPERRAKDPFQRWKQRSSLTVPLTLCAWMLAPRASPGESRRDIVRLDPEASLEAQSIVEGARLPALAAGDTVWIADWSFEDASGCTSAGWTKQDLRILNDGSN